MKKAIYSAVLILSALILSSCRGLPGLDGRDGRDGIDGLDGRDGLGVIDVVVVNVPEDSWKYSHTETGANNYYYATVDMPEITEEIFDKGLVKVYRVYNFDKKNASQVELPYVRPVEYEEDGQWYSYVETVDCEFFIGEMTIAYTASDFAYEYNTDIVPEAMQFRCVIMY